MFANLWVTGPGHVRVGRTRSSRTYQPNGDRETARRRRQNARMRQLSSHLDDTVWPGHLGWKSLFRSRWASPSKHRTRGLSGKVDVRWDQIDWAQEKKS